MKPLLETFCLQDGTLLNPQYHTARIEWSLEEKFPISIFEAAIQKEANRIGAISGKWRASVTYSAHGVESVRLVQYHLPEICGLKFVTIKSNFYQKKWADRSLLNQYKALLPQGVEPIFVLDNHLTDTTFTNILLERKGLLYTPSSPLLHGTKRCQLLEKGLIHATPLSTTEIVSYDRIHLINAMLDPGELTLPISSIQ